MVLLCVGDRKRDSGKILAVRASLPPQDQDTLVPCPACNGSGRRVLRARRTEYSVATCKWCDGMGSAPNTIVRMFHRWTQIRAYNVARGTCYE